VATATRVTATVMATMWAMAMATRLVGDKEGKGEGGKGNDNSNEGGGQGERVRVARRWQ
jgi:hypothetical protein